jgi:hypothetical protein
MQHHSLSPKALRALHLRLSCHSNSGRYPSCEQTFRRRSITYRKDMHLIPFSSLVTAACTPESSLKRIGDMTVLEYIRVPSYTRSPFNWLCCRPNALFGSTCEVRGEVDLSRFVLVVATCGWLLASMLCVTVLKYEKWITLVLESLYHLTAQSRGKASTNQCVRDFVEMLSAKGYGDFTGGGSIRSLDNARDECRLPPPL